MEKLEDDMLMLCCWGLIGGYVAGGYELVDMNWSRGKVLNGATKTGRMGDISKKHGASNSLLSVCYQSVSGIWSGTRSGI